MYRIVFRQEEKLHLFLHVQGLECFGIAPLPQLVVGCHGGAPGGKRLGD